MKMVITVVKKACHWLGRNATLRPEGKCVTAIDSQISLRVFVDDSGAP